MRAVLIVMIFILVTVVACPGYSKTLNDIRPYVKTVNKPKQALVVSCLIGVFCLSILIAGCRYRNTVKSSQQMNSIDEYNSNSDEFEEILTSGDKEIDSNDLLSETPPPQRQHGLSTPVVRSRKCRKYKDVAIQPREPELEHFDKIGVIANLDELIRKLPENVLIFEQSGEKKPGWESEDRVIVTTNESGTLLAIADGHDGFEVADYITNENTGIKKYLLHNGEYLTSTRVRKSFRAMNNEVRQEMSEGRIAKNKESGSTLSATVIARDEIMVATVGDSPVVIVNQQGEIFRSRDHNWYNEKERQEKLQFCLLQRFWPDRGNSSIEVSRDFGYWSKNKAFEPVPDVSRIKKSNVACIIMMSDGGWNNLPNSQNENCPDFTFDKFINRMNQYMIESCEHDLGITSSNLKDSWKRILQKNLVDEASFESPFQKLAFTGVTDDVSIIIYKVNNTVVQKIPESNWIMSKK